MPARLKPGPLAGARDPLAALRLRGWILEGVQPLDGVLLDRGRTGPGWRGRLRPWLDHAAEVRERGDLVLVLFGAPLVRDCAALGPVLPVRRRGGALATLPFAAPDPDLAAHLDGRLVLAQAGRLDAWPLQEFRPSDVAAWWGFEGIEPVPARAVPGLALLRRRLASAPTLPHDAEAEAAVFAPVRAALAAPPRRTPRMWLSDLRFRLGRAGRRLARALLLLWTGIVLAKLAALVAALALGGVGTEGWNPLPLLALLAFVLLLLLLFAAGGRRAPGGAAPSGPAPSGPAPSGAAGGGREPGRLGAALRRLGTRLGLGRRSGGAVGGIVRTPLWRRMAGWLAWRSPLGSGLRRRYQRRFEEIERLFRQGRIDEALRKAIALSAGQPRPGGLFGDLPLGGPGTRARLDLDLSGRESTTGLALSGEGYHHLQDLYREHARLLAAAGDVDRAVFVLAELLDAPEEAVRLLADHGRHDLAARLGQARRLAPRLVIPLWVKAGRPDRALGLAARHDLFEELWKEIGPDGPFRSPLAEAWAGRLAAAGDLDRAARIAEGIAALADRRPAWLAQALEAGERPLPETLARACLALDWRAEPGDPVHRRFQELLQEPGEAGAARRLAVAAHLLDSRFEAAARDGLGARLALLAHGLVRHLAADEGTFGHAPARAKAGAALAEAGGLFSLRVDLRRLAKVPKPAEAAPVRRLVVEAGAPQAAVADAALLAGGRVLVGHRSGLLRLLAPGGRELWRGQVNGLLGLVTVGEGGRALVLREGLDGPSALLFSPAERRLEPWGALPVAAWHPHASEVGWPVFDGAVWAMLDTAPLLRPPAAEPARLAHHWAVPITEPGRALAFLRAGTEAVLVHGRQDGLVEWWSLDLRTLRVACRFWTWPPRAEEGFAAHGLVGGATLAVGPAGLAATPVHLQPCERALELSLLRELRGAGPQPGFAPLAAAAGEGDWAACAKGDAVIWRGRRRGGDPGVEVVWQGSGAVRARFAPRGSEAVLFDDRGRLLVLDAATGAVSLRQA